MRRSCLERNFRDGVLRIHGALEIHEQRLELSLSRQAAQCLTYQARLAHPALSGQQRVRSVADTLPESLQFGLPVEEPAAVDPVSSCLYHFVLPTGVFATR